MIGPEELVVFLTEEERRHLEGILVPSAPQELAELREHAARRSWAGRRRRSGDARERYDRTTCRPLRGRGCIQASTLGIELSGKLLERVGEENHGTQLDRGAPFDL